MAKVRERNWTTRLGEAKTAWVADYSDADGRHIKTFDRKKDAENYLARTVVDIGEGTHIAPSKSETISQTAERWLKQVDANGREATTLRQYRQHVDLHIVPRIGNVKLANLNPHAVDNFRDHLLENLSRPMARKVLVSFKSILKAAKRAHLAAGCSIGRNKREERKLEAGRDFPTTAEVSRLIRAAEGIDMRRRVLILVAIFTGLRASELRGLRWVDVDLTHGEIHVRQRADRYLKIGNPKSESSVRTVPIDPFVVNALREWKVACPKVEEGLVFPSVEGRIEHHANMLRGIAPVMVAAGLTDKKGRPKYALHAFRHFFASWCINRKADGGRELPAKLVQELLGHSSIVMTLDRYGHLFPRGDDRAELADSVKKLLA